MLAAAGLALAWTLPFAFGAGSLVSQAFRPVNEFGPTVSAAYPDEADLLGRAYYGLAAYFPVLSALLVLLAGVGVVRAQPGRVQKAGLLVGALWVASLVVLFLVVEVGSGLGGGLLDLVRGMSPGGLIGALAGLIALIGLATRWAAS